LMGAPFKCAGCSLGHLANARTLLGEVLKFQRLGETAQRDAHLFAFLGELRQAEEQHPDESISAQMREIRKRVEAALSAKQPIPDLSQELEIKGVELIRFLGEHPELCPTCTRVPVEHE